MPSRRAPSSSVDSTAQLTCGLPKPRNAVDGHRVRQDRAGEDPHRRHVVRPRARVRALAHDAVRDVGVRADQVVRGDVLEQDPPVGVEADPDVRLARRAADGLERLLEAQHEADRPAQPERGEHDRGLVLRVLLAAEPAARVGRDHPDPRQRHPDHARDHPLEPVGVLDRAPHEQPVVVRRGHERVGLDRELGDHREAVRGLDDERRTSRPPRRRRPSRTRCSARTLVAASGSSGRSDGSWTSGASGASASATVTTAGSGSCSTRTSAGGPLREVPRLRDDERDRLAVVVDLPGREHRPVLPLRPEPRHGLRQVRGGQHEVDAGQRRAPRTRRSRPAGPARRRA